MHASSEERLRTEARAGPSQTRAGHTLIFLFLPRAAETPYSSADEQASTRCRTGRSSLGSDSVVMFDATSGERRGGFSLEPLANTVYTLAISPDGRWLAFAGVKASVTYLGLCRTDGSQARRLVEGVPRAGSIGWSTSGDAIYYLRDLGNGANVAAAGDLMKLRISRGNGEPRGEPRVLLGGAFVQEFSISRDGRQLAYTKAPPQQKIWAMTLSGPVAHPSVEARELTVGTSVYGTPDISPNGRWVAFARNDAGSGNLYITPFDHFEPRPLTTSPDDEWSPRWSPDGRAIAYAVRNARTPGILIADVATGRVRRIANDGLAPLGVIAWMPSGDEVVFPLDLGHHYAIVSVTDGHTDTLSSPDSVAGFHVTVPSPDGHRLAVMSSVRGCRSISCRWEDRVCPAVAHLEPECPKWSRWDGSG